MVNRKYIGDTFFNNGDIFLIKGHIKVNNIYLVTTLTLYSVTMVTLLALTTITTWSVSAGCVVMAIVI